MSFLFAADVRLFFLINGAHTPFFDAFFLGVTWLGNGWVTFPFFILAAFFQASRRKVAGVLLAGIVAFGAGGILTSGIKKAVDRRRPPSYCSFHGLENSLHVVGPRLGGHSFPSGHTQTAFTVAVLLVLLYGGAFWASLFAAFLVAYSRVYLGVHFPLDALGGMVIGAASAWAAFLLYRRWFQEHPSAISVDIDARLK